jgi:hypothetical protein
MSLQLMNRRRRSGGDPAAAVEALLSGTAGFAFDPSDETTLFQDTAATVPVTAVSDPVARVNTFWGASAQSFQQPTAGSRPAWDGTGVAYDGADDLFSGFTNTSLLNNVPGAFYCERFSTPSFPTTRNLIGFSTTSLTNPRFLLFVETTGAVSLSARRLDADATTTVTSSAGVITADVAYVISAEVDYAGTGLSRIWVNGTLVASGAIAGVAGNTSATASARFRKGSAISGAAVYAGWTRRGLAAPFVMSDANRAAIEAWAGAV